MPIDRNVLEVFVAVAAAGNFTAAAQRLGVTRSAVSQAIKRLEDDLGIALVQRTTRHVRLTEPGERLRDSLAAPMAEIAQALEAVTADAGQPRGHLRIAATSIADQFLSGPLLARFAELYPGISLDITVTDAEDDIVGSGFDAGVRLGELIEQDMVAVALTGPQRQVTVASPAYLAQHGTPLHPQDLVKHRCIGWRPTPATSPYRWEFAENGVDFDVAVNPQLTSNDMGLMVRLALADGGITFGMEATFAAHLQSGALVSLLDAYLPAFAGFYLYFPSRRNMESKLRLFVDHCRAFSGSAPP